MNYHLKFLLLVVLRILSWIIIMKTTVVEDKFTIRQIVSIVTRNHFRKTWMRPNKIHLGPVYSYLILIFIRDLIRWNFQSSLQRDQTEREHKPILDQFWHRLYTASEQEQVLCFKVPLPLVYALSSYNYLRIRLRSFVIYILSYYSLKL